MSIFISHYILNISFKTLRSGSCWIPLSRKFPMISSRDVLRCENGLFGRHALLGINPGSKTTTQLRKRWKDADLTGELALLVDAAEVEVRIHGD